MNVVTKLVLPLAGIGKRLRPLTYQTPKNLLPVNGKPLIEYTFEEGVEAGIKEVVLVIGSEHVVRYEQYLKEARKKFPMLKFHVRVQEKPFGNGHAILQAADVVEGEPFAVRFPDDILCGSNALASLADAYRNVRAPILLLERVPWDLVSRYGVVKTENKDNEKLIYKITSVVEKPKIENAPSNLIIIGAYILTPEIIDDLEELARTMEKKDDALLLISAFEEELKKGHSVYGMEFTGRRLDCGTLENYYESDKFFRSLAELS